MFPLLVAAAAAGPLHHGVYGELLGGSGFLGAQYELGLGGFHTRAGLGFMPCLGFCSGVSPLPNLGVSYATSPQLNHHLELAANAVFVVAGPNVLLHPGLGYRYERPGGGFLFRVEVGALYSPEAAMVLPWGGLAMGYGFPVGGEG